MDFVRMMQYVFCEGEAVFFNTINMSLAHIIHFMIAAETTAVFYEVST
jgi:hypothetical protein